MPIVNSSALAKESLETVVTEVLAATPFLDIHTHLFAPELGSLGLWALTNC
jgi:hypothetical protein